MQAKIPTAAVNPAEAREFIRLLTGSAETPVTLQTFSESPEAVAAKKPPRDPLARVLHGPLEQHCVTLQRLNEAGAGVFITVNETDLQGRSATNVKRVRAGFLDLDDPTAHPLDALKGMPLEPHIVVESSPGKAHAYWRLADCPIKEFTPLQTELLNRYGGDPKIKDLPRVMRLPGFLHMKHEPFRSRIVSALESPPYTRSELQALLPINQPFSTKAVEKAKASAAPGRRKPGSAAANIDQTSKIRSALAAIPPNAWDDRDVWLRLGMALHHHGHDTDNDTCFELWCGAAEVSKKYDAADSKETWAHFSAKKRKGITIATLYHEAQKHGWRFPRSTKFSVEDDGVYFRSIDKHGEALPPVRICGPLAVVAQATDRRGGNWGLLLEFVDRRRGAQRWVMPAGLLASDAAEVRAELLSRGLWIGTSKVAREQLTNYLNQEDDLPRAVYVTTPGWCGTAYVLPDRTVGGPTDPRIVFQGAAQSKLEHCGTLEQWRDEVSSLAVGNSRLVFAISTAFAAPLLHMVGADGGGFHFGGDSSQGKTSIVRAAASVWGGPEYVNTWRATANGLEGIAQQHNDGLLVLDELNQIEPREAGEAAYMLANGRGKARASRTGAARPHAQWRLLYLSTGELVLAAHMTKAGHRVEAGQAIRLAEIPADAERGFGIYEELHGRAGGAALSTQLVAAAGTHYGVAGARFLESVTESYDEITGTLNALIAKFTAELLPPGAEGQAYRAAGRFALVAAAGTLAQRFGLTGWPENEALGAVRQCFRAWLAARGGPGNQERRATLHQVRRFLELHGRSRFLRKDGRDSERTVSNRAGFYDEESDGTWFYVLPEAYTGEMCQGRDPRAVSKILIAERWLIPDGGGKSARSIALPGIGQARCYLLAPRALQGEIA